MHRLALLPAFFLAFAAVLNAPPSVAAVVEIVAGGGEKESGAPALECRLHEPFGVEFLPGGGMLIVEMEAGNRILKVDAAGTLTVLAGTGAKGFAGDGGPARDAAFNGPHNLAVAPNGDIYVADTWNHRVRRIDGKTGIIETIAGTGRKGFSGDGGRATEAEFGSVIQIALDPGAKNLYVADIDNRRVRRIALETGVVKTVAGNGKKGVPMDGAMALQAPLLDPRAVAVDADGGIYILERGGNALRHVDPAGQILTVAGDGRKDADGDGGPARAAALNGPKHLTLDRDGSVLIADAENHSIRRYSPKDGRLTRVAGTGRKGSEGIGGSPLAAALARPHGVTIGPDGCIYIADSYNDRILRITP